MEVNKNYEICYESDASGLRGKVARVFFPETIEKVIEIIKTAGKLDIVPRGFGTNTVGGCVPNNSIIIDMKKMNKATKFNTKERTVNVEAGASIKELNEKLEGIGYEFPIFSYDNQSVGGMIALNRITNRSMRYGSMKDWVEEIELVNGRGETVKIRKTDMTDVSGMEGTTGIIASAKLKIIPLIKRSASIFQSDEIEEALSVARRLKLEREIIMLKLYSKEISKLLGLPEKYHVIIEFDSERGKIKGREYEKILKILKKEKFNLYKNEYFDVVESGLFFDKIEEFCRLLEENKIPYSGDLGLGIIYPYFKNNENPKKEKVVNFLKNTKAKFKTHGFGLKRKDLIEESEKKVIQRVRMRYDPFQKMNRGKITDSAKDIGLSEEPEHERVTAEKIVEEIKSPTKKMETFIEGVKTQEKIKDLGENIEINRKIEDYNKTFNSEINKTQKIESFAKEVPREIYKKEEKDIDKDKLKDALDKLGLGTGFKEEK